MAKYGWKKSRDGHMFLLLKHKGFKVEYVGVYNELRVSASGMGASGKVNINPKSSWYGQIDIHGAKYQDAINLVKALQKGFNFYKKNQKKISAAYNRTGQ